MNIKLLYMRYFTLLLALTSYSTCVEGHTGTSQGVKYEIWNDESAYRMWNYTYAPYQVMCPSHSLIREAGSVS